MYEFVQAYLLCPTIYVPCPCQTDMIIAMSGCAYVKCQQLTGIRTYKHTHLHVQICKNKYFQYYIHMCVYQKGSNARMRLLQK